MTESRENFDNTNKFIKATVDTIIKMLTEIAKYREEEMRNAHIREFMKWCRDGGEITPYEVQGNCKNELKEMLDEKGIAYLNPSNSNCFIIKEPDKELVRELNTQALIAKTNYYQEIDTSKMEDAIANSKNIKDKEILTLHDLDKYECEVLKNKCNNITKGFMVGIEKEEDGKYSVSVHAQQRTYCAEPEKTDLCKAYAQMAFSLYGDNMVMKKQQVEADEKLDLEVAALKGCENTHYVIGIDNPGRYIEITAQGFELHQAKMENENIKDYQLGFISKDDPAYEVELQKALDSINNKTIIDSKQKLNDHISTKDRTERTARPEKDKKQKQISYMEKNVINKADEMIKNGPKKDELSNASPIDAFEMYEREIGNIMDGVINGKDVPGYDKKDLAAIKEEFDKAGVEPSDYKNALNHLNNLDVEQHRAKKKTKVKETQNKDRASDSEERER